MTFEEHMEIDSLKRDVDALLKRVSFLEELCANYHNVLNELRASHSNSKEKLYKDYLTREGILLHTPHFCELIRNGNMGFERNVG